MTTKNHTDLEAYLDALYAEIILALPDSEVLSLPKDIALSELARRYPELFDRLAHTIRSSYEQQTHPERP